MVEQINDFENTAFETIINFIKETDYNEYINMDWNAISCYRYLSDDFMEEHYDLFDINVLCTYQRMSETFVYKHPELIRNKAFRTNQWINMSPIFKDLYQNKYYLANPIVYKHPKFKNEKNSQLFEYYLNKLKERDVNNTIYPYLDFKAISGFRFLSFSFIEKHFDKLDTNVLILRQKIKNFNHFTDNYENEKNKIKFVSKNYFENYFSNNHLDKVYSYEFLDSQCLELETNDSIKSTNHINGLCNHNNLCYWDNACHADTLSRDIIESL
jgi:hypothetical protein